MDTYVLKFQKVLKEHGLSVTGPRLLVFNALYSFGLQSISDLTERCAQVDRASVYRTVALLEDLGVTQRVHQGFKYKIELGDMFLPHHHHITCTVCGKLSDIEQARLEQLLHDIAESENYQLTSHKVELVGVCQKCQAMTLS